MEGFIFDTTWYVIGAFLLGMLVGGIVIASIELESVRNEEPQK